MAPEGWLKMLPYICKKSNAEFRFQFFLTRKDSMMKGAWKSMSIDLDLWILKREVSVYSEWSFQEFMIYELDDKQPQQTYGQNAFSLNIRTLFLYPIFILMIYT